MARSGLVVAVNKEALRKARQASLMTQRELAAHVGLTHLQISRIETGVQNSSSHNIEKIAGVLGVPVSELLASSEIIGVGPLQREE